MLEFGKPLKVQRRKLMADLLCMAFWAFLLVGLFAAITLDKNLTKRALWFEFPPLIFLIFSVLTFLNHLRVTQIRLHSQGLEIPGERGLQLLEWKNIDTVNEARAGITILGKKRESLFIPRTVNDYEEIRKHIFQMTGRQTSGTKAEDTGKPSPSGV